MLYARVNEQSQEELHRAMKSTGNSKGYTVRRLSQMVVVATRMNRATI